MALPDLQFADTDARRVEARIITGFESAARLAGMTDFRLADGDPRRLYLQAIALMIAQQNASIDKTGKGNLLRYAGEETIADIGYLYGTRGDRLEPKAAVTTIEYTLSTVLSSAATVPAGSRIGIGNLVFRTKENLEIPAGSLTGVVSAECDTTGLIGNGFLPGQINTLIDRPSFIESAVNITESAGGAGLEGLEAYRARIRQTPESFSVAGPDGAYIFWAFTANQAIIDVAVWMPTPGHVNIALLTTGGELATSDIKDQVYETCNDKTIRPLTDFVHLVDPDVVQYDIDVKYWIDSDNAIYTSSIEAAVEAAVEEYRLWQRTKIGRDIIPDELIRRMMSAGARRIEITAPVYTVLEDYEVAQETSTPTIVYGGLEHA